MSDRVTLMSPSLISRLFKYLDKSSYTREGAAVSSPHTSCSRERLLEKVLNATQESSTLAVLFHSALAEQVGLGATEEKTLALLHQFGSLTAGEIARHTGLTTPSV